MQLSNNPSLSMISAVAETSTHYILKFTEMSLLIIPKFIESASESK